MAQNFLSAPVSAWRVALNGWQHWRNGTALPKTPALERLLSLVQEQQTLIRCSRELAAHPRQLVAMQAARTESTSNHEKIWDTAGHIDLGNSAALQDDFANCFLHGISRIRRKPSKTW